MNNNTVWKTSKANVFWSEIAPCDHVLQIYDTDDSFLQTLTHFVGTGINAGNCTVVIATRLHLDQLEKRLQALGLHLRSLQDEDIYIPLDAETTLAKFMVADWPDGVRFQQTISTILERAKSKNRQVRAFAEMVALLWAEGKNDATVALENLWNEFMHNEPFSLFCAYPKTGFTQNVNKAMNAICSCHSKMIKPAALQTEVVYCTT